MDRRVIIVDDCAEFRFLFSLLLEQGLKTSCLGLSSLAEVKERAQDVLGCEIIVLDINLGPGQPDGVAVYDWLKANHYAGKVFFLTGHAKDSPFLKRAILTGIPVLEKPMSPGDLVSMLEAALSDVPAAEGSEPCSA